MEQNKKRSKNDERKQHVDRRTGLPKKKLQETIKENEAQKELRGYVYKGEEHPYADD